MNEAGLDRALLKLIGKQRLSNDAPESNAMRNAVVRASLAILTPEQLAEVVMTRVLIERGRGVLMQIYDMDADNALELLRWGSERTNVKMGDLARQLSEEFASPAYDEPETMRSAFDDLLFTASPARKIPPPNVQC